jgi:hypothetical protein
MTFTILLIVVLATVAIPIIGGAILGYLIGTSLAGGR